MGKYFFTFVLLLPQCMMAQNNKNVTEKKHTGQTHVRKAFEEVFLMVPDARWENPKHFIVGDRGVSEWFFSGTRKDGSKVEVTGCGLFTFKNGKIAIKNSYRKNRLPAT